MKRIIAISSIAAAFLLIVVVLIRNKKTIESKNVVNDRSKVSVAVKVQPVRELPVSEVIESPATLMASEEAFASASSSGRIVRLAFDLGSAVSRGQILGSLDTKELRLQLQAAQVEIERLTQDYERNKVLVAGNAINVKALHDSKFELDKKKIEAEQLKKQLVNANIISPISGIIDEKTKEEGEFVGAGEAIATVVNTGSLKARVFIPERTVFKLRKGQKAKIVTDVFPDIQFEGSISFISSKGDENHNYLVEVTVANKATSRLKAGMYAMIRFDEKQVENVLQVSKSALVDGVTNPFVFVLQNDHVVEKKITIGRELGDNIEILGGLLKDEVVVVSGQINIANGSKVKPIRESKS